MMPGTLSCPRRLVVLLAILVLLVVPWQQAAAETPSAMRERLVFAGPPASVSYPLIHMLESGALDDLAQESEFILWHNPDQLRALVMQGEVDFVALPTNVAANLYNQGVPLTLMNVATWGALWMVSRTPGLKTLADFRGEEVAIPFRADMPDIVFGFLAERQGLDPHKDFQLRYTASPMDALQLLVMRRINHALLSEPAISMALHKTRSLPVSLVAPELHRSVDLQQQWGELTGGEARIPQAGLAVLGATREDADLVARVEAAYENSAFSCFEQPVPCGKMVARRIDLLSAEAVADSLLVLSRYHASAAQAHTELEAFFQLLLQRQPASVGGKLPDADFYGGEVAQR